MVRKGIQRKLDTKNRSLLLVLSYSLEFKQIKHNIHKHLPLLSNDHIYAQILDWGINVVAKNLRSLGNYLSPSFFKLTDSYAQSLTWINFRGNYKCGSSNFPRTARTGYTVCSNNGKIFKIDTYFNYNTNYVIYVITCGACSIEYVGRTIHRLRGRFCGHLSDIRNNKSTNVAFYFNLMHGGDLSLVQVQVIEKVKTPQRGGDLCCLLCKREVF